MDGRIHHKGPERVDCISAVTLATHDMARAVRFYEKLGFTLRSGGAQAGFTSLDAGNAVLNLIAVDEKRQWAWWGRVIFYVPDVDVWHCKALDAGLEPSFTPEDAPWDERYFHITDPDGHELSFARPLPGKQS